MTRDISGVRVLGVYAGVVAPNFEAKTLDGKPFRTSDLKGKVVLLDFWATWCAPCLDELPNITKMHDEYGAKGLTVVSISFDRDAETARKYVTDKGLGWTHIWAEGADKGPIADLYGVSAIPATFLIGADGKVIGRDLRGSAIREALGRALPGVGN